MGEKSLSGKILIVHHEQSTLQLLNELLSAGGYQIASAHDLASALSALQSCPDILLLEANLLRNAAAEQINHFQTGLEVSEVLCLRICSPGQEFEQMQELTPFACGTLSIPVHRAALLEQVDSLLRIKNAENDRNRAQEQLAMHRLEVEEGLRSAAQIQHALLPSTTPISEQHRFAWTFVPCETVGGDLFNLLQVSEDTLAAYILDVSGHGVSSALVTVSVHQSLSDRTSQLIKSQIDKPPFFQVNSPAAVLRALDEEYPFECFEKFFTMTYLTLDRHSGRMCYANAGHPPPIHIRADGSIRRLESGGTLIGLGGLVPYEEEEVLLEPGDRVYLFSDGISEYETIDGRMFGEERLIDFLLSRRHVPLTEALDGFMLMLHDFGEGLTPKDDISLFAVEYCGEQTLP